MSLAPAAGMRSLLRVAWLAPVFLLAPACTVSTTEGACLPGDPTCNSTNPYSSSPDSGSVSSVPDASSSSTPDTGSGPPSNDAGESNPAPDSGSSPPPEDSGGAPPPADSGASPPADSGAPTEAGSSGAALGATCTQDSDCASNLCEPFDMQTVHYCTQPCQSASDCPVPPTAGVCTPNGYCKFN